MKILVINAGSSSLKYQVIDMTNESVLAKGNCEKIGFAGSFLKHKANGKETLITKELKDHADAIKLVLDSLIDANYGVIKSLNEISAVGHRVLHGGEIYKESVVVDAEVLKNLYELKALGPLHMPANILGIEACMKVMPKIKNVAVFDTAFHSQMPPEAFLYAVPYEDYKELKIRKYGFHGTSHKYVATEVAKLLNKQLNDLGLITVHLGNGSSIAAIKNGHTIDTTMGYTPLEGLMMGTRSGDIDPSVLEVISKKYNFDIKGCINYLNKKCGILGINGKTPDMRENEELMNQGNERALLVPKMLAYRIKKYIGAYFAILGKVDAVVFMGGIGENDARLREAVCEGLESLGIILNKEKNITMARGTTEDITGKGSKVKIFRIPTDEELVIARDTFALTK